MKFAIALGGLVGFGVVYVMALLAGKTPAESLGQASIGAIVVGIMFRWVTSIWIRNVKQNATTKIGIHACGDMMQMNEEHEAIHDDRNISFQRREAFKHVHN